MYWDLEYVCFCLVRSLIDLYGVHNSNLTITIIYNYGFHKSG
jgi:hypothetical protein